MNEPKRTRARKPTGKNGTSAARSSRSSKPTSSSSTDDYYIHRLAALLSEAAPLAQRANDPSTSDVHRSLLRQMVGQATYCELSVNLSQMRSWRTWEVAHGNEAARIPPRFIQPRDGDE